MTTVEYLKHEYGFEPSLRAPWEEQIKIWRSWYRGVNNPFLQDRVWNGKSKIVRYKRSMQMAKKVCEDWADILYNSNCPVKVEHSGSNQELQEILNANSWWLVVNQACEKAFAVGTVALTVSVADLEVDTTGGLTVENSKPKVSTVDVEKIFPLSWHNGKCTECAFVDYQQIKKKTYVTISAHVKINGKYTIENHAFEVTNGGNIVPIAEEDEAKILGSFSEFPTGSEKPWFVLISPAISENIFNSDDITSDYPLGISIFANAIDAIHTLDDAFDAFDTEINLGRKRIFASESLFEDVNGEPVFDATDCVYMLPNGMEAKDLLIPENNDLRIDQLVTAINASLSTVSSLVGMGKELYKFDVTNVSTAAQVYSTNSELKRKMDKHRTELENELVDFLEVLIDAANTFSHYNIDPNGLTVAFDYSQFEDEDTKARRKLQEKEADLISAAEYRINVFGENEETAKKRIEEINAEKINELKMFQNFDEPEEEV